MVRTKFERSLGDLTDDLVAMGSLVEHSIQKTLSALTAERIDRELIDEIKRYEEEAGHLEHQIESQCLRIMLSEQPVARDLRAISTALKMVTDLERIADQAANIADIVLRLPCRKRIPSLLLPMSKQVTEMVKMSIDAFVSDDQALAETVIAQDDEVDRFFVEVRLEIVNAIRTGVDDGEQGIDVMMIAKYLERIADHAVNIAEWVIFNITGMHRDRRIL